MTATFTGTETTLIEDLLKKPKDSFRDQLIKNAREGLYHDFKSLYATPKIALIQDLARYGYRDLARKAKSGAYDDQPSYEDAVALDADLSKIPGLKDCKNPHEAAALIIKHVGGLSEDEVRLLAEEVGVQPPALPPAPLAIEPVKEYAEFEELGDPDVPVNYSDMKVAEPIDQFEVVSWCPTSDATTPPTQVHLLLSPPPNGIFAGIDKLAIRIKSRERAEWLCAAIMKHAEEVWPART